MEDSSTTNTKERYMLTTVDNPYDPYTQFDLWLGFDKSIRIVKQFDPKAKISTDCNELLDRIAITSNDMTEEENQMERQRAIDEIIDMDPWGIYTRAYPKEK